MACIEGNYWGTIFEIFDNGLDEKLLPKIPSFFANKRRKIVNVLHPNLLKIHQREQLHMKGI